jgi:hypothetical protein
MNLLVGQGRPSNHAGNSSTKAFHLVRQGMVRMYLRTTIFSVLLLVLASAAGAAPTIGSPTNPACLIVASSGPDNQMPFVASPTDLVDSGDSAFAGVADDFLKPASAIATPASSPDHRSANLPAVPSAMLMVILGSLCVILVRDRAVWFVAASGLMWFGLAGIQLVPQLAMRLTRGSHNTKPDVARAARLSHREISWRLRSETEGTQYIGLLRHLAGIPLGSYPELISSGNITLPCLCAITSERRGFGALSTCPAPEAGHVVCFLSAVILEGLWRGPPELGKKLFSIMEVT